MSRQIYFFHSESDVMEFIRAVDTHGGKILVDNSPVPVPIAEDMIIKRMQSYSCKFYIIPAELFSRGICNVTEAMKIECKNCCKGNALSRTYEIGRLYITKSDDGTYVKESVCLYESLKRYIKSNYQYLREKAIYFGPDFGEKYRTHSYYALYAGRPITNSLD